ncbi:dihydrolipoyl dehydrogenase [Dysosmobacter sp.]|uniref:dihydrolipoyl dehydrogenase n=1 Tax=Dysosmobacter sp. TaxID=2591382 RepID=UPI002A8E4D30|nr:dihydrolipoyl dehydrogenase [Dysosmobacter sp.]MDY3282585.1 dihydrolipoyl dehydrogenase [Dysosmobacter sp.]
MENENSRRSVVVIGGGPGGYVAAIRAAQLGAAVTLVEKEQVGGTCLNRGCIPTKALLHPAEIVRSIHSGGECGVHAALDSVCWPEVVAYKDGIVRKLTGGVAGLLRSSGVTVISGTACFVKPKAIEITAADGSRQILEADRFLIATGSVPVMPPIDGLRESRYVVDSTGALSMETLPGSMMIIGGGVIGVEMAAALNGLGCRVTIVEALPGLVPTMDGELAGLLAKNLEQQGIEVLLEHKVVQVADDSAAAQVTVEHHGERKVLQAERVLCAVGRRPFIDGLNAEGVGIRCEKGRILTDEYLETSIPGVYAIGDCLGQVMLAHTASAQGEIAAANALGERIAYRPACVPSGIYGFPELAGVGMTEEQLRASGIPFHTGRFPLAANGRALIANGGSGMVKVLIGDELNEVLGVHILGPGATEIIGEAAAAISLEATAEDIIAAIHAHPTVTESLREAVLAAEQRPIHIPGKFKKG